MAGRLHAAVARRGLRDRRAGLGNGVEHLDVAGAGGVAPGLDQIELLQRQAWLITTRVLLCPDDDVRSLRAVRPGRQIATHHCTSQLTGVDRIVAGRQSIADIGGWRCPACERADADARSGRGEGLPTLERIRSEEHPSELQSLMRISYAVFCLKKKKHKSNYIDSNTQAR